VSKRQFSQPQFFSICKILYIIIKSYVILSFLPQPVVVAVVTRYRSFALKMNCAFVDCDQWTSEENTNYAEGEVVSSANSVSECQQACINNASCTGVDFVPDASQGQRCWMSGSWSGAKGTANGVTHYDLNRDCEGNVKS